MGYSLALRIALLSAAAAFTVQLAPAATVAVVATSTTGAAFTPEIHLYRMGSRKDFWPPRRVQTASGIPFGFYQIEVFVPGFRRFQQDLDIIAERTDVRASLLVGMESNGTLEMTGRVLRAKSYGGLWVLLFPLAGSPSDMIEALVGSTGAFRLTSLNDGPYLLTVVRGDEVLSSQPVYMRQRNPELMIDVGEVP